MRLPAGHRQILHIALPSIVSNITVPLLGLADVTIVGHLGATAYIGAIAVGGMLFNMAYWLFGFLRMGTSGLTAQAYGRGDRTATSLALVRSLAVAFAIAALLIALHAPLSDVAFRLIGCTPGVEALARRYFEILIWGAPAVLGLYGLAGWFIGMQNAYAPLYVAVVQNVVNIAASTLLVFGLGWRVEGVAAGTLIAQYAGLLMAVAWWWRGYRRDAAGVSLRAVADRAAFGRFFAVNRDIFLRTLCLIAVTTFFTSAGAAAGDLTLAANALLMQLFMLFSYVMDGFAYAGEAIAGRSVGAADRAAFAATTRRLMGWGLGLALAFTLAYAAAGGGLLSLLTSDAAVVGTARAYLPWAIAIPLAGFAAFIFDGIFVGATATGFMLLSMAAASAVFFLVYFTLSDTMGNHALWLAFVSYLAARGAVEALCQPRVASRVGRASNSKS